MTPFFEAEAARLSTEIRVELGKGGVALVSLVGPLGAGKTTFTKELMGELGYNPSRVQSPTFLKLLEYRVEGVGLCLHLDCYRISELDEFEKIGLETLSNASVWIVEWPDLFFRYLETHPGLKKLLGFTRSWNCQFSARHKVTIE